MRQTALNYKLPKRIFVKLIVHKACCLEHECSANEGSGCAVEISVFNKLKAKFFRLNPLQTLKNTGPNTLRTRKAPSRHRRHDLAGYRAGQETTFRAGSDSPRGKADA